jgi:hypothetical protein
MTAAQTLAAFRRAALPAIAVGLAAMAMVMAVLLSRPATYQAQIGVVASLTSSDRASTGDYGAVVAMTMQALPQLAVSDPTIKAISDQLKNSPNPPDPDTLRKNITVDLVPSSGVARITVISSDQQTAIAVLKAVLEQIQKADLLAPVATLKPLGGVNPSAQLVERDPKLALGLGLVAAVIATLTTVVLVQALRPRLLTPGDVERVVDDVFEGDADAPPVVDLKEAGSGINLLAAHLLSQAPHVSEVTVIPAGPAWRTDLARQLRSALRTLRVAREVGLPADPYPGDRGAGSIATAAAATAANGRRAARGIAETGSLPLELLAGARRARTTPGGAAAQSPFAGYDGGAGSTGTRNTGGGGSGGMGGGGTGGMGGEFKGPDGLSHLVVTVRLGRTTPVALTTALIALRSHGAGIAGVAVS